MYVCIDLDFGLGNLLNLLKVDVSINCPTLVFHPKRSEDGIPTFDAATIGEGIHAELEDAH